MKKMLSVLLVLIIFIGVTGCNSKKTEEVQSELVSSDSDSTTEPNNSVVETGKISGKLNLYTSEPEELVSQMITDFNKTYPDVEIELFRAGTGAVVSKIDTELETGDTEANIVWFADIGYIKKLDDQGLIMHYTPQNSEGINEEYKYNNGMAHEVRLIYNVLAYNTTKVDVSPTDWIDVTKPEYKGSFAMANPNYSGGAFTALVVNVQNSDKVGWEFYEAAADNDCKYEESNGNLQTKISSGEYSAVAIVDFMARNAKNEGSPIDVVWPTSGAILIPTPIALVNNIPEESQAAAKAFIDYMYDTSTQELFVKQGYIPIVEAAGVPEGAPKVSEIVTMPFDLDFYIENSSRIREEYTTKFGE